MAICELMNVRRSYGSGAARVDALKGITLTVEPGEFTVLCGPSGSGKTTLLNQIGLLDVPDEGSLVIEGQAVGKLSSAALSRLRGKKIGFIFQSFNLIPVLSARENVELALQLAGDGSDERARADDVLKQVGLEGLGHRRPNELSGGQQQRVAVARALVKRPVLVIADEPTANLDSTNGVAVLETMQRLNREYGTTFVFSSHDAMVVAYARRVVTLHDGAIVSDEKKEANPNGASARTAAVEARP